MKKIGIKNFRVFKELTEFEIRPITILTGPNNSGKSSFTKLLLLLKNGYNHLNFKVGEHNLENFEDSLNWDTKSDELKIRFQQGISILPNNYSLDVTYTSGVATTLKVTDDNGNDLFSGIYKRDEEEFFSINLKSIADLLYNKELLISGIPLSQYENTKSTDLKDLNFSNLKEYLLSSSNPEKGQKHTSYYRAVALLNEINCLDKDYRFYELYHNGKNISDLYADYLNGDSPYFKKSNPLSFNLETTDLFGFINNSLGELEQVLKNNILKNLKGIDDKGEFEIRYSKLGKLFFSELIFGFDLPHENHIVPHFSHNASEMHSLVDATVFDQFKLYDRSLKDYIKDIEYISANRGSQKRVLLNKGESQLDEIVLNFAAHSNEVSEYLQKVLMIFEINGEIEIERFQNFASVIYITKNKRKIALSDMGFGYSQILPILLKIINYINNPFYNLTGSLNSSPTFIIEEPEANLHPNLQSRFADFLQITNKYFPEISFIIETHSEYLIRKLQYLTGKKQLKPVQTAIYYFNDEKNVSELEPKIKKIEINEYGGLTDTFGPGFFDEATRLQFELLKLNQNQYN